MLFALSEFCVSTHPHTLGSCGFPTPHFSGCHLLGLGTRGACPGYSNLSFVHRFRCVLALSSLAAQRYYDGSDSCCPSPRVAGLPAYLTTSSRRCASNHVVHPGIALHAIFQRTGQVPDLAMNEQARRVTPPNRVRHPAHRQFASSCSPPRFAATQLLSATGSWLALAQTFTVQMSRLHGRTHCGLDPQSMQSEFMDTGSSPI